MKALEIGAPKEYLKQLKEHADIVNLPRIGVDENVAFPAVQANVAPAVTLEEASGTQPFIFIMLLHIFCFDFSKGIGVLNGLFWPKSWSYRRW